MLGQPMAELLMPEREREFRQHAEDFLRSGDPGENVGRIQVPVLRADGTVAGTWKPTRLPLAIEGKARLLRFPRATSLRWNGRRRRSRPASAGSACWPGWRRSGSCRPMPAPVRVVNERSCALTGTTEQDAAAANWAQSLHPDECPAGAESGPGRGTRRRTAHRLPPGAGERGGYLGPRGRHAVDRPGTASRTGTWPRSRTSPTASGPRPSGSACSPPSRRPGAASPTRPSGSTASLAAAIPGAFILDERGLISQLNQSFCDLFGIREDPARAGRHLGRGARAPDQDGVRRPGQLRRRGQGGGDRAAADFRGPLRLHRRPDLRAGRLAGVGGR